MGVIRTIWNGPFAAPPLEQPITATYIVLKVLETAWRALLLLVAGACAIAAFIYYQENLVTPLKDQIGVEMTMKAPGCTDPAYPVGLKLTNNSDVVLGNITVSARAYEQGQSNDIIGETNYRKWNIAFNDVLRPGYVLDYCVERPTLSRTPVRPVVYVPFVEYASELDKDVPLDQVAPTK